MKKKYSAKLLRGGMCPMCPFPDSYAHAANVKGIDKKNLLRLLFEFINLFG